MPIPIELINTMKLHFINDESKLKELETLFI